LVLVELLVVLVLLAQVPMVELVVTPCLAQSHLMAVAVAVVAAHQLSIPVLQVVQVVVRPQDRQQVQETRQAQVHRRVTMVALGSLTDSRKQALVVVVELALLVPTEPTVAQASVLVELVELV
jgi:hypothetical protein